MKSFIRKSIAVVSAIAVVASLAIGANVAKSVKADSNVAIGTWTFTQGGQYNPNEPGNEGYLNSITMASGTSLTGWLRGQGSVNQAMDGDDSAGFTADIENTGWDCQWSGVTGFPTNRINPWSISAVNATDVQAGHTYTVTFKAKANKKKYGYVAFGSLNADGSKMEGEPPIQGDGNTIEGDNQIMVLGTAEKTFSYTFTNWVSAKKVGITIMLGAFDAQYDYAGEDVSSIITEVENGWNGTVQISNLTVTDKGQHPDFIPDPEIETQSQGGGDSTTVAPTQPKPTNAPVVITKKLAKVTGLKVKNTKKKTIKVSFKKVANATKYQIKVGSKNFTSTKASKTIKNKVVKKGKKITVKVRATAAGYTAGAWATKKVKIKK